MDIDKKMYDLGNLARLTQRVKPHIKLAYDGILLTQKVQFAQDYYIIILIYCPSNQHSLHLGHTTLTYLNFIISKH